MTRDKNTHRAMKRARNLRFEPLERRELLAITTLDPADGLRLMNPTRRSLP